MKTTLNIDDATFRNAKAKAALEGITLGRFVEESLKKAMQSEHSSKKNIKQWLQNLPDVPKAATLDLNKILEEDDFRSIDPGMWL